MLVKGVPGPHIVSNAEYGKLNTFYFSRLEVTFCFFLWSPSSKGKNALEQTSLYPKSLITRQIWGIWKLRLAYSPETPNLGPIGDVLYRVTLKFDGWPWKTIGHLSFAVSSFVQHFIAIGEFKLELQSGNAHFGSNSTIFRAVWPWNLMDDLENQ